MTESTTSATWGSRAGCQTGGGSFDGWLRDAGWHRAVEGDALVYFNSGREIRYYVRQKEQRWVATVAERAGRESLDLVSSRATLIVLYLIAEFQSAFRQRRHYPPLRFFVDSVPPAPGYQYEKLRNGWWGVFRGEDPVPIAEATSRPVALRLTYTASHTPEEVRAAFADPTGEPLFAQFLQPHRPPADLSGFRKLHGIPDPKETDAHD